MLPGSVCKEMYFSGVCSNANCPYPHSMMGLVATRSSTRIKRTLCKFWEKSKCHLGDACTFAHGVEQLTLEERKSVESFDRRQLINTKVKVVSYSEYMKSKQLTDILPSKIEQQEKCVQDCLPDLGNIKSRQIAEEELLTTAVKYKEGSIVVLHNEKDVFKIQLHKALDLLTYENANRLGSEISRKITCPSMYQMVAEEVIDFGIRNPKPNLIYFVVRIRHQELLPIINQVIANRFEHELKCSEERGCATIGLENIGNIVGQVLINNKINTYLNDSIKEFIRLLIRSYQNDLGVIMIPYFTSLVTVYAKTPVDKKIKKRPDGNFSTILSILEDIVLKGIIPRHLMHRIKEMLIIAEKNGGFEKKNYKFDNPNANVIKRYKPCEKVLFGGCVYENCCKYDHTFIIKYLESKEGQNHLAENGRKLVDK